MDNKYVNRFTAAVTENKTEVVLRLFSILPEVDHTGAIAGTYQSEALTVVMTGNVARTLVDSLQTLLSASGTEEKIDDA